MYDILSTNIAVAVRTHPELAVRGSYFLDEFGKHYGVRGFYRLLRKLTILVEEGSRTTETYFDYKAIATTVKCIVSVLSHPEHIKLTQVESTTWTALGKKILDYFIYTLSHFRVTLLAVKKKKKEITETLTLPLSLFRPPFHSTNLKGICRLCSPRCKFLSRTRFSARNSM